MGDARLCVLCRTRPVDERWRPFCGERCRNHDLARWADGDYRLPADTEERRQGVPEDSVRGPDSDADDPDASPD